MQGAADLAAARDSLASELSYIALGREKEQRVAARRALTRCPTTDHQTPTGRVGQPTDELPEPGHAFGRDTGKPHRRRVATMVGCLRGPEDARRIGAAQIAAERPR